MNNILVRNVSRNTNKQLKYYAKKLRISRNDLINLILDDYAARRTELPYEEIGLKLKYLEEMTDMFYWFEDWKIKTNSGLDPYIRILDAIDLGEPKKG